MQYEVTVQRILDDRQAAAAANHAAQILGLPAEPVAA
jgi:hypothetical protein